ncbi:type I methionyl aminopeptidase [Patescibacteria group bacterium]|nr:type I methionyl aminopeptidase [Patescibacteria group bacterium]MBU1034513.1 type I methionyl aminopeptidase [Patescibacteria group bacterium]MBU1629503.1 type I methionyl aminopeptidase [Patescibacteria group bacterium]MBU1907863.1 type I methionyl aminopeptidase [Patescibacteria group bacterium]
MSLIKTAQEITKLKRGGVILSNTLGKIMRACQVGASTAELDQLARAELAERGARPSFLGYQISPNDPPYPAALCISINDEVVHGQASSERIIKDGDVVGLDIGAWYEGLATDMAATVIVGRVEEDKRLLVENTKEALKRGLAVVKEGALVGDIGAAIEDFLGPKKYGIIRDLVGHGVGHAVHEEPQIPNFRDPGAPKTELKEGMVLAIEPMVALGTWKVKMKDDGWTIVTADGSPAAHFEVTIAVTKNGYELITPWPDS